MQLTASSKEYDESVNNCPPLNLSNQFYVILIEITVNYINSPPKSIRKLFAHSMEMDSTNFLNILSFKSSALIPNQKMDGMG